MFFSFWQFYTTSSEKNQCDSYHFINWITVKILLSGSRERRIMVWVSKPSVKERKAESYLWLGEKTRLTGRESILL